MLKKAVRDNKEFDVVEQNELKNNNRDRKETWKNYINCESTYKARGYPAFGNYCSRCRGVNHFEWVCKSHNREVSKDGRRGRYRTFHHMH